MGAGASSSDVKELTALYEANRGLSDEELLTVFRNFQRPEGINLRWMREFMVKATAEGANFEYLSTKDICIDYVVPVCSGEAGETYLDYLKLRGEHTSSMVGPAHFYISHTWKYYYSEVLEALENYFMEDLEAQRDVYVYFDLFCHNPKTIMSATDHINIVAKFSKVVHVLCDLQNPVPFTSARCLLDVFLARDMDVAMKRNGVESELIKDLTSGNHLNYLTCIDDIDINDCKTYRGTQSDFEFLQKTFVSTPADHETFNRRVKANYVQAWIVDTMNKAIQTINLDEEDAIAKADINFTEYVMISRLEALSMLFKDLGRVNEALNIRKKCLALQTKVYGSTSPVLGATWANIAVLYEVLQDWVKALEAHQTTLGLYMQADGAHAPILGDLVHSPRPSATDKVASENEKKKKENEDARVLKLPIGPTHYHLAVLFEQRGDLSEALEHFKLALTYSEAHRDNGGKHAPTAHRRHGHGHGTHESHPSRVVKTITEEDMPPHALKGHIGDVLAKQGDLDEAIKMITDEVKTLESLLGDNDASLGLPYGKLSTIYHKRDKEGDLDLAQDYLRKAEDVAPKLAPKLHTLFDREESRRIEKIVEAEMAAEEDL